jgi:hypothetical protein
MSLETEIENAIINDPAKLGFPKALSIRNFRIAELAGAVDVVLFPRSGPFRLVLVEAKVSNAKDAKSHVVGQLLMYYGGALTLGTDGIEILCEFAQDHRSAALSIPKTSPSKVLSRVKNKRYKNAESFELLCKGERVKPKEVALFIALNGKPHPFLSTLVQALRKHHGLNIGLVLVQKGKIKVLG